MKSRELNKLYQIMRVSRFYYKHKNEIARIGVVKKIVKTFDDKIDEVLVNALKQKEDFTYGAKQKNAIREELTTKIVSLGMRASLYFSEKGDFYSLGNSDFTFTFYKGLTQLVFTDKCQITLNFVELHIKELKPYGIREKDLIPIADLIKRYDKIIALPRSLHKDKKYYTENILNGLEELNKIQRTKLDKITASFFESETVKSEYRKARKYVRYKNPQGMFDAMLGWYRGMKKGSGKKQVLSIKIRMKNAELKILSEP